MESVTVYFIDIDSVKDKEEYLYSVLPPSRTEKAKRFAFYQDKALSLAAGYLVYRVIGGYFVDPCGKPRAENVYFSISHSGQFAALAVSEKSEIGLDIEALRDKDTEALARHCLNDGELLSYRAGTEFLSLFTAKESLAKADGAGLTVEMKSIPALPMDGAVKYKGKNYFRHTFLWAGYFTSVTKEGEDFSIKTEILRVDSENG